jgi:uncharacterized protein (UPF0332 family)
MKFSKEDLVKYRLEKAYETFNEAKLLAQNNYWNAAASKLYYSCFYIIHSLFVKNNIATKSHAGTRNQFHLHYIKSEIIGKEYGVLYKNLFSLRQLGDYEDFVKHDEKSVAPLFTKVESFLEIVSKLIISDEP